MTQSYKAKVAHMLDNGDKLEFEAHVDASSHDEAFRKAQGRLQEVVKDLAGKSVIEIDKSKVEFGAHKH
jgi:hypothetical protein